MTPEALALSGPREIVRLDVQALIAQAIESKSGIETLERLVALALDVKAEQAREAWYASMAEFQRRCPPIKKTKRVNAGPYSYSYAPLDEILSTIQPVMGEVGLSVSWVTKEIGEKVSVACRIAHELGHVEDSGAFVIPIMLTQEGRGANAAQRVGIARTYACRYSLLGILALAPEDDKDGADHGERASRAEPEAARAEPNGAEGERTIGEGQVRMLSAVATGHKWSDDQLHELLSGFKCDSRKQVRVKDFDAIVNRLKQGPGKA